MKNRAFIGMTLVETMVAVALFAVLMMVLSFVLSDFQKLWGKEYSKNDASVQFVKIYRNIDFAIMTTCYNYVYTYNRTPLLHNMKGDNPVEKKWFFFPVSAKGVDNDGYPVWRRLVVYALEKPENDECLNFKLSPHKNLVKYDIMLDQTQRTSETNSFNMCTDLNLYRDNISQLLSISSLNQTNSLFPIDKNRNVKIDSIRVIANNIVDLDINMSKENRAEFKLTVLRIQDAQKAGVYSIIKNLSASQSEFPDSIKPFLEELSWTSVTTSV